MRAQNAADWGVGVSSGQVALERGPHHVLAIFGREGVGDEFGDHRTESGDWMLRIRDRGDGGVNCASETEAC